LLSLHQHIDRLPWVNINISLHSIFDANKLVELNFLDWYQNVRIVLKQEKILYVLENLIPPILNEDTDNEVRTEYQYHIDDNDD